MRTPIGHARFEIIVKKSRFIALAEPLTDPKAARTRVKELREAHPGANHVVHAFICGAGGEISGMSDDGEPSGTAGRPVHEILGGRDVTNVFLAVIRYFGGTKLGTGGLVKAYGDAAKGVMERVPLEELVEKVSFSLSVPYHLFDRIKSVLEDADAALNREEFTDDVILAGTMPKVHRESVEKQVSDLSSGRVAVKFDHGADNS